MSKIRFIFEIDPEAIKNAPKFLNREEDLVYFNSNKSIKELGGIIAKKAIQRAPNEQFIWGELLVEAIQEGKLDQSDIVAFAMVGVPTILEAGGFLKKK